jgi:porphobilinogen synthase
VKRLQRLRLTAALRDLVSEVGFSRSQLIQPLFVQEGATLSRPIPGLRDNSTLTQTDLLARIELDIGAGVRHFLLFVVPEHKREHHFSTDFASRVITNIKSRFGAAATLWVDTCLCSL